MSFIYINSGNALDYTHEYFLYLDFFLSQGKTDDQHAELQHMRPETNNKIFPTRLLPIEGQQYPGWHKDTTRKRLWGGEDDEIP